MAYKPLIVFITTLSILILCISLNTQTDNSDKKNGRTFAEKTGEFIGDTTENTTQKAEDLTNGTAESTGGTLDLGFDRPERTHTKKQKDRKEKKDQKDREKTK